MRRKTCSSPQHFLLANLLCLVQQLSFMDYFRFATLPEHYQRSLGTENSVCILLHGRICERTRNCHISVLRPISSLKCFITLRKMNGDLESWSKSFLPVQCNLLVTKLEKVLLCLAVLLSSILNIHLGN